jgi:hypothetical protein
MKQANFEVRAGRPTLVIVDDPDDPTKRYTLAINVSVMAIRKTDQTNADGSPLFQADFAITLPTVPDPGA